MFDLRGKWRGECVAVVVLVDGGQAFEVEEIFKFWCRH